MPASIQNNKSNTTPFNTFALLYYRILQLESDPTLDPKVSSKLNHFRANCDPIILITHDTQDHEGAAQTIAGSSLERLEVLRISLST